MSNMPSVVPEKSFIDGFVTLFVGPLVDGGVLNINFEANTIPNTVHCIKSATKSIINIIKRLKTDACVLLTNSFNIAGTVQTAFIIIIARATSIFGNTRKTNIETPKLCAVSMNNSLKLEQEFRKKFGKLKFYI